MIEVNRLTQTFVGNVESWPIQEHSSQASNKQGEEVAMAKRKYGVTRKSVEHYKGPSSDLDPLTKSGKRTTSVRQGKLPSGKKYMVTVNKTEEELHGGAKHKSSSSSQAAYSKDLSTVRTRPGITTTKKGHKSQPNKYMEMKTIGMKKPSTKKK